MKEYFFLILLLSIVIAGCQQVEETNSTVNTKTINKAEVLKKEVISNKENSIELKGESLIEPKEENIKSDLVTTKKTKPVIEEKVEKKPTPKPKKVTPKPKKTEKKLSANLVKNTKTAAPKKNIPKGSLPKLQFEYKSFDFGTVDEGDTIIHKFKFKNTGDAPAIITEASSSCGCTVPSYPKKPIKPGENGVIEVMFNTKGKLLEQKKSITLTANTEPKYNTLYLEGLVYRRPAKKEEKKEEENEKLTKEKKKATKNEVKKDSLDLKNKNADKKKTAKEETKEAPEEKTKKDTLKSEKP